jgi:hypothetical protein
MRYLIVYILIALSTTCFAQENNVIDRKSILKEIKSLIKSENYSKVNDLLKDAMNKYSELSTYVTTNYFKFRGNLTFEFLTLLLHTP